MTTNILRCPCGKIPESLCITSSGSSTKWASVYGSCCDEWMVEFKSNYHDHDSAECIALAISAWNDAPRYNDDWQPIDTAPKDGTIIILYRPEIQFVGFHERFGWVVNAPGMPVIDPPPTHWKPQGKGPVI